MHTPAPAPAYAELHCVSNFTFLRGASRAEELIARAKELGYAALAITDECSLAGIVRAHVAAKEFGLKLIVGAEFALADGLRLVLLAMDREGYGNLSELITRGRRSAEKGSYLLTRNDFEARDGGDGNCLGGCLALWLPPAVIDDKAVAELDWLKARFSPATASSSTSRLWIAVELHLGPDDAAKLATLVALGKHAGIPLVAAGDVHMHLRSRRALQDTLTAIRLKTTVAQAGYALHPNGERYLRELANLERLVPPALLLESVAIAKRCTFSLDELRYEYPEELVPAGETPASHLRNLTENGLQRRFPAGVPAKVRKLVEHELALISELRYEAFFLTVHDIVAFARSRHILCQGRGSAANSTVCYALYITEVDPSRMEMLFERFISKERNEPPDIDVDFEHQRREEVMQYVYEKYGRDRAALAATVITYRPKSALRDVGKALGLDLAQVDRLSKSFAWWDGRQVLPERLAEAGFDTKSPAIAKLMVLVNAIVGFPRHLSQHVGGFVISRGSLERLVPVENAAMVDRTVIQWDKDDLDALGLLKVDCLALGMLSAIRRMLDLVSTLRGTPMTMAEVPAEDPATYAMIGHADTIGVFQIESRAQMAMLPRLLPSRYYDLVIEVAIVRPGPIQGGMVHPYLRRRQGLEKVEYPSEAVKGVLERTLGVPIFQEQVMQLAVVAAGFTPGEADQLRRSMAAWKRKGGLEHFEEKLISGMQERGYAIEFAQRIFQQIQGFGEYGFPESHAASFALLVYISAWLKCHEPAAFTCGLLNSLPMGFYAPAQLVADARRHHIEVRAVDVTVSTWDCALEPVEMHPSVAMQNVEPFVAMQNKTPFVVSLSNHERDCREPISVRPLRQSSGQASTSSGRTDISQHRPSTSSGRTENSKRDLALQPAIRLGFRMVSGFSEAAAERIAAARAASPFEDVEDLAKRCDLNRHDLDCLAASGALAPLAGHRRHAYWDAAGVERMSARDAPLLMDAKIREEPALFAAPSEGEDLVADYRSLGFSLGRHPLALLRSRLTRLKMRTAGEVMAARHGQLMRAAGLVTCRQRPGTASGVTFVTLEDETGFVNVVVWRDLAERQRTALLSSRLMGVTGVIEREGEVVHLVAGELVDYSRMLGSLATRSRNFH